MAPQASENSPSGSPTLFSLAQIRHLMRVEFSRALRYSYPIVCLMVAVDRLDQLKDRVGWERKEEVIDAVIGLLALETRQSDFLGRLPDDRFLVVVPHMPSTNLFVMADRIVARARTLRFDVDGTEVSITLSVGASWMEHGETLFFDDLLETAERSLIEAAAAGGDRCVAQVPGGGAGR